MEIKMMVTVIMAFSYSHAVKGFKLSGSLANSCVGRCGDSASFIYDCQCNTVCSDYKDCCSDYSEVCVGVGSCKGKCNVTGTDPSSPCQCNKPCVSYGDCCPDYTDECVGGDTSVLTVTDEELCRISEQLFSLEGTNNAASYVKVDLQSETTKGSTADRAPSPLLTVQSTAYEKDTIKLLLKLQNNYIPEVDQNETITPEEEEEQKAFLDAVFNTSLFQLAKQFLISKQFLTEANFRSTFEQIWFDQYSRSSGFAGSSGFEHVFVGELKNGVSGFHNWVHFATEEAANNLDYHGYLSYADFGNKGKLVGHNFEWLNNQKPISSMLVGTSPELELSIFTICWYARPNGVCPIQFNGVKFYVTTYDISYNGRKFVATSYADP